MTTFFFFFFLMEDINIVFIALECFWKHFWSVFMTTGYVFCYFFKWKCYTNLQVIQKSTAEGYSTAHRHSWLTLVCVITIIWCTAKQNTHEQSPTLLTPQALSLFQWLIYSSLLQQLKQIFLYILLFNFAYSKCMQAFYRRDFWVLT